MMAELRSNEISHVLEYISRTHEDVAQAVGALSETQYRFKPAPDRWSIAEILEHMATVEERVLGPIRERLMQSPPPEPGTDCRAIDALLMEKVPDRSVRVNAPEPLHPTGLCGPAESLDRLRRNHEQLSEFVRSTPDLREHALEAIPLKIISNGRHERADGYQWVLLCAGHDRRHLAQIHEVQTDPAFPRAAAGAA
jgi:hypothetical protein